MTIRGKDVFRDRARMRLFRAGVIHRSKSVQPQLASCRMSSRRPCWTLCTPARNCTSALRPPAFFEGGPILGGPVFICSRVALFGDFQKNKNDQQNHQFQRGPLRTRTHLRKSLCQKLRDSERPVSGFHVATWNRRAATSGFATQRDQKPKGHLARHSCRSVLSMARPLPEGRPQRIFRRAQYGAFGFPIRHFVCMHAPCSVCFSRSPFLGLVVLGKTENRPCFAGSPVFHDTPAKPEDAEPGAGIARAHAAHHHAAGAISIIG